MSISVRGIGTAVFASALAGAVLVFPSVAKADATAPDECAAPRVTGVSTVLDAVATGSAAGPSVIFGVAQVPLSQTLPAPLDAVQAQFIALSAERVQQMRADAPQQVDQARAAVAPLAGGNQLANPGVEAFAYGLESVADTGGSSIAPADTTLREVATIVRASQETSASC